MPFYVIPAAGVSSASFFTPENFADPARPPAFLARNIDAATGDWASILSGIHPVDDQVIRAFRVTENSGPAAVGVGNRFVDIKHVDDTTERRVDFEVRRILDRLIKANDLRIDKLQVTADPDTTDVEVFLAYTNLQSQRQRELRLRVA